MEASIAKRRRNRTSNAQMEYLIDYMSSHSEFAAGRHCGERGNKNLEKQWERLTNTLNGFGDVKTVAQWQKLQVSNISPEPSDMDMKMQELSNKFCSFASENGKVYQNVICRDAKKGAAYEVWTDVKSRSRNKAKGAAKNMRQTGNPSMDSSFKLTAQETRVLSTMGEQSSLGHRAIIDSMGGVDVVFDGNRLVVIPEDEQNDLDDEMEGAGDFELCETDIRVSDDAIRVLSPSPSLSVELYAPRRLSQSPSPPPSPKQSPCVTTLGYNASKSSVSLNLTGTSAARSSTTAAASSGTAATGTSSTSTGSSVTASGTPITTVIGSSATAAKTSHPAASLALATGSSGTTVPSKPLQFDRSSKGKSFTSSSKARQHFSRARDQRQRREDMAVETRDRFAAIQESQVKSQELMARALMKLTETDAVRLQQDTARLEQDKVTSSALLAMAEAITGLTRALECQSERNNDGSST